MATVCSRPPGRGWPRRPGAAALLFAGSVLLISLVTATLNLDTSVAFLTPVLVHTARSRGEGEPALLYGCLLLSNAGSLLLPGSNLTNLIVLGHLHLTGGQFAARMWLPSLGAVVATAAVVAVGERRSLRRVRAEPDAAPQPVVGLGLAAILAATVVVVVIRSSALPVFVIGVVVAGLRIWSGRRVERERRGPAEREDEPRGAERRGAERCEDERCEDERDHPGVIRAGARQPAMPIP